MLYTPLYNRYDPDAAPAAVRFQTHGMIDEIALCRGNRKVLHTFFPVGTVSYGVSRQTSRRIWENLFCFVSPQS